jgi:hypothetical protein
VGQIGGDEADKYYADYRGEEGKTNFGSVLVEILIAVVNIFRLGHLQIDSAI